MFTGKVILAGSFYVTNYKVKQLACYVDASTISFHLIRFLV